MIFIRTDFIFMVRSFKLKIIIEDFIKLLLRTLLDNLEIFKSFFLKDKLFFEWTIEALEVFSWKK